MDTYPPAYPQPIAVGPSGIVTTAIQGKEGMTLRDAFAIAAIQSVSCGIIAKVDELHDETGADCLARAAYQIADAMLEERRREKT